MANHKKNAKTEPSIFECDECDKVFTFKNNLLRHISNIHESDIGAKKLSKCPICKKHYKKTYLKNHIRAVHQKLSTAHCQICGKKYSNYSNLRMHMHDGHSNNGRPMHACAHCNKSFNKKFNLKIHLYVCDPELSKLTTRCDGCNVCMLKSELQKHKRTKCKKYKSRCQNSLTSKKFVHQLKYSMPKVEKGKCIYKKQVKKILEQTLSIKKEPISDMEERDLITIVPQRYNIEIVKEEPGEGEIDIDYS